MQWVRYRGRNTVGYTSYFKEVPLSHLQVVIGLLLPKAWYQYGNRVSDAEAEAGDR
jgi:hypothetical protein